LDRVHGVVGFGDGKQGLIPPISKDNLVLRGFASGGGEAANTVATPLAIKQLKTSLPFVNKVFNLTQATGGAAAWSLEDTKQFGPQSIKNRGRAVTTEDYEWMVRERFGQVAKVRCLPTRAPGDGGLVFQPGAVTVIVIPKSAERLPQPSNGLLRAIREYLQEKTLGSIVGTVHVIGPSFRSVSVAAVVKVSVPQEASLLARRVANALESWLHPLSGGDTAGGWEFGRAVYLSEVFAVIARVSGVDHVQSASFIDAPTASSIPVDANSLTASGIHVIEVS
jgi:predicted phage baseplate assembly protein